MLYNYVYYYHECIFQNHHIRHSDFFVVGEGIFDYHYIRYILLYVSYDDRVHDHHNQHIYFLIFDEGKYYYPYIFCSGSVVCCDHKYLIHDTPYNYF